jgi:hypothetical protein
MNADLLHGIPVHHRKYSGEYDRAGMFFPERFFTVLTVRSAHRLCEELVTISFIFRAP